MVVHAYLRSVWATQQDFVSKNHCDDGDSDDGIIIIFLIYFIVKNPTNSEKQKLSEILLS
jgi:hypothetical protein